MRSKDFVKTKNNFFRISNFYKGLKKFVKIVKQNGCVKVLELVANKYLKVFIV
jgi:hypothetical protein